MTQSIEWNYISESRQSSGYEDVLDLLKTYTKSRYINSSPEDKKIMIEEIFNLYRQKNIFPIQYYNEEGILSEIQRCIDKKVSLDGDVLDLKFNQGQSLCRFLFPNLQSAECKGAKNNSPYYKFYDDEKLTKAIAFCLNHKNVNTPAVPSAIKDGLEMIGGNVPTNYKAMNVKALCEKYCDEGIIYDFACGFGGRMLGVLSSDKNYKYIGVEPCIETFNNLNKLGQYIERVKDKNGLYEIYNVGSEDFMYGENTIDFAFSSPPYFNLEKYCDEETQCYIKYPTLEEWVAGYVVPTISNIHQMLKKDKYYAVNIADFKIGKKQINFVDEWINISRSVGFTYCEQIFMTLQSRRGVGHDKDNNRSKKEGIFVFKK